MTDNNCAPWRNPRVLLTLGLIFFCGLIAGGLVMRFGVHQFTHTPEPVWQEGGKEVSLERLTRELELTPAQREHLEMVLDDFMMYVQTLQSQMDEVRALGKDRILRILDDEQKRRFEEMLGELQAQRVR